MATDKAKDIGCSAIRLAGGGAIDGAAKDEGRCGALIEILGGALGPIGIGQGHAGLELQLPSLVGPWVADRPPRDADIFLEDATEVTGHLLPRGIWREQRADLQPLGEHALCDRLAEHFAALPGGAPEIFAREQSGQIAGITE